MGCCSSKPKEEAQRFPYESSRQYDDSSRAINGDEPQTAEASNQQGLAPATTRSSRHRRNVHPEEHINKPLRPHVWTAKRQWTRAQLDRERHEFFETRVTGRPEIWATLKSVTELLANNDTATAQSIVDAAAITVPTGNLKNGAYDEAGNLYQLPEHIISDPSNIVLDSPKEDDKAGSSGEVSEDEGEQQRRRQEKGKAPQVEGSMIRVKARLSDRGGPDVCVEMEKEQTVRALIRRIREDPSVEKEIKMRIAYMGKILKENKSLSAQGWREGHVVNALVF